MYHGSSIDVEKQMISLFNIAFKQQRIQKHIDMTDTDWNHSNMEEEFQ